MNLESGGNSDMNALGQDGWIFLIEKGWIDPMENRDAYGYTPFGYVLTEQDAREFCESKGYWTDKDCWAVAYHPNKLMAKYRYKAIQYCG